MQRNEPNLATSGESFRQRFAWPLVFWLTAVASALPIFSARFLPFTDLPEHVAAMSTIADLLPGGPGAPYTIALRSSQYFGYHAIGALIARVVHDAVLGNQILLAFVAILWPLSMRSRLRALHHDERLAIFACLLFWNRALAIGFLPFVASVPVAIFIIAGVVRQTDAFSIKRSVILAFASIGLFYIHVSGYLVAGVASAGIVLAARPRLRQVVTTSAAFIPSAIVAALWSRRASLTRTPR